MARCIRTLHRGADIDPIVDVQGAAFSMDEWTAKTAEHVHRHPLMTSGPGL